MTGYCIEYRMTPYYMHATVTGENSRENARGYPCPTCLSSAGAVPAKGS